MIKKILIVGGTGFLGFHLASKCIKKGWHVTSISTHLPKKDRRVHKVKYLILDISKKKQLKKIKSNFDYVINFGGYVNHTKKIKTYQSHYIGCKNLVDFFLDKKIKSFIQIGSSIEYGNILSPQIEKKIYNIKNLKSIYGKSKLLATRYVLKKSKDYNFPGLILRLYQVYGPGQYLNRFIPFIINGCIKNSSFPCSHGLQKRDFLYIDDFINSVFKCFKYSHLHGEIINIGYGEPKKLKNIVKYIRNLINGGNPEYGKIKIRKDEILETYQDKKKAKKLLKWKPKVKFQQGIKKTINFYKQFNLSI